MLLNKSVTGISDDIRRAAEDLHQGTSNEPIYSIRVDNNKENAMFVCQTHLNIIVMSEMKHNCTSCTTNDFYFVVVNKRFCTGCIRHFCQKYTFLFPSVDFSLVGFCVM